MIEENLLTCGPNLCRVKFCWKFESLCDVDMSPSSILTSNSFATFFVKSLVLSFSATSPSYLFDLFNSFQATTAIILRIGVGRDSLMLMCNWNNSLIVTNNVFSKIAETGNKLSLQIRAKKSRDVFKSHLKTRYLKMAYDL